MTIRPIQFNTIKNTPSFKSKEYKSYLEAEGAIDTTGLVKPLPPKGHLVKDSFGNKIKYFFKDIAYDFKSVKNGFNGTANDHQLGRLNDVGLKLGGIGIAAYLASKTKNPKARLMEYIGLGAFLATMSIYPKLAINAPSKIKHGFDINKEYIDDQGRKKSVFQDSNYVPYEMYTSSNNSYTKEDLDKIGDELGIPRDIINRHDVIKEQMRKIATQNHTLWMLSAGFATPAITALMCYALENYAVVPALEKTRNNKINREISALLAKTSSMTEEAATSKLSLSIEKILNSYKGKEIPEAEIDKLIKTLSENLDDIAASGIKKDISNLLKNNPTNCIESYNFNNEIIENLLDNIKKSENIKLSGSKREQILNSLIPTKEEFIEIITKFSPDGNIKQGISINKNLEANLRNELSNLIETKAQNITGIPENAKGILKAVQNTLLEETFNHFEINKTTVLTEETINKVINFSKIIGEFKENLAHLDKCKSVKFEFTEETMLARASAKIEKLLLKEFDISFKEMKLMRESSEYTKEIIEDRLSKLAQNEARYKEVVEKIGNAMSDMEVSLHSSSAEQSQILDLINAFEHNFNNTAKRIAKLDESSFKNTISNLVKETPEKLDLYIKTREDLFNFLDGLKYDYKLGGDKLEYIKEQSKGVGSSKNIYLERIFSRYQSSKNVYNRILHSMEVFKRATNPAEFSHNINNNTSEYMETIIKMAKDAVLEASSKDHTLKLNTINNEILYKDIMNAIFKIEGGNGIFEKGFVTDSAKEALGREKNIANGNILERFQFYIARFKNLIANNTTDFTKPEHIINYSKSELYANSSKSNNALFDLIGQSPVEFFKNAAKNRYGTMKWFRIVGSITGGVLGITLLAQLGFGKLRNPQNLKKQVSNDTSK